MKNNSIKIFLVFLLFSICASGQEKEEEDCEEGNCNPVTEEWHGEPDCECVPTEKKEECEGPVLDCGDFEEWHGYPECACGPLDLYPTCVCGGAYALERYPDGHCDCVCVQCICDSSYCSECDEDNPNRDDCYCDGDCDDNCNENSNNYEGDCYCKGINCNDGDPCDENGGAYDPANCPENDDCNENSPNYRGDCMCFNRNCDSGDPCDKNSEAYDSCKCDPKSCDDPDPCTKECTDEEREEEANVQQRSGKSLDGVVPSDGECKCEKKKSPCDELKEALKVGGNLEKDIKRLGGELGKEKEHGSTDSTDKGFTPIVAGPNDNGRITFPTNQKTKGLNHTHPIVPIKHRDPNGNVKKTVTPIPIPSLGDILSLVNLSSNLTEFNNTIAPGLNTQKQRHEADITRFETQLKQQNALLKTETLQSNIDIINSNITTLNNDIKSRTDRIDAIDTELNVPNLNELYSNVITEDGTFMLRFTGEKQDVGTNNLNALLGKTEDELEELNKAWGKAVDKPTKEGREKAFLKELKKLGFKGIELFHRDKTTGKITKKSLDERGKKVIDEDC